MSIPIYPKIHSSLHIDGLIYSEARARHTGLLGANLVNSKLGKEHSEYSHKPPSYQRENCLRITVLICLAISIYVYHKIHNNNNKKVISK